MITAEGYIHQETEILQYQELIWDDIVTPIKVESFAKLLKQADYDNKKSSYLLDGFTNRFDIGYRGPQQRKDLANNIPIRKGVGSPQELWNKVMKEVKAHHYAGPFKEPPMQYFVQSPLRLVPKAGNKTRLIFHLSYDFGVEDCQKSVNWHTPDDLCTVKYQDLDSAVRKSLQLMQKMNVNQLWYAKSDCSNAFHLVPAEPSMRYLLTMKAQNPETKEVIFFINKCLPFGSSILCAIFQEFSDALKHIAEWKIRITLYIEPALTNYLDDFLIVAISMICCNQQMKKFLLICEEIGCPISSEKTEWASQLLVFLGILLNGRMLTLSVPVEKCIKATSYLKFTIDNRNVTIKFIQQITGILNFINKAIIPGWAFTRAMYRRLATKDKNGNKLKQHHHIYLKQDRGLQGLVGFPG